MVLPDRATACEQEQHIFLCVFTLEQHMNHIQTLPHHCSPNLNSEYVKLLPEETSSPSSGFQTYLFGELKNFQEVYFVPNETQVFFLPPLGYVINLK